MTKKSCKFLSIILAAVLLISAVPIASFGIDYYDNVKVVKKRLDNFYYNFWVGNSPNSTNQLNWPKKQDSGQYDYITADGQVAYCVQPGVTLDDVNTKTVYDDWSALTSEQQKYVKAALIYGYNGYTRYGQEWQTEYAATQAVIWAIVTNNFNTWTEEIFLDCAFNQNKYSSGTTSSANRTNARSVYYTIKDQVVKHYTIPSFTAPYSSQATAKNITLKWNSATNRYEGSVTDTNGVVNGYTFTMSGVNFERSGNTLKISTTKDLKNAVVSGDRTHDNTGNVRLPEITDGYCVGSDQVTATAINRKDPVNAYFSLTTESRGKLTVHKTSEQPDASSATFTVTGPSGTFNITTSNLEGNKDGKNAYYTLENLLPGTYTVTENGISNKYYVEGGETATVTVVPNQTASISFNNLLKRGNLRIQKISSEDNNLAGWEFRIHGIAECGDTIDYTVTTGANGAVTFVDIPIGTYTVEETNCPSYMIQPSSEVVVVSQNSTANVQFENKYKRGDLFLSKVDEDTGDVILNSDARFGVYEWNNVSNEYDYVCDLTYSDSLNAEKYGSSEGYFAENLPITGTNEGKYRVIEITAPGGYVTDGAGYNVTIQENGDVVKVNDGTVTNKIQKAKITLIKTDKETGTRIPNAVYEVYAKTDIVANGVLMHAANDLVATLVTGNDGTATTDALYLGEYYVKEKTAPEGYVLDKEAHDITLTYDANSSEVFFYSETVSDMPQKGRISVTKYDSETNNTIAASAKYGVYAAEDIVVNGVLKYKADSLVDTIETSNNGKGTSDTLYLGRYYVKEIEAPYGYNKNDNTYYVTLLYHGQNVSVFNEDIKDYDVSQKGQINITKIDEETGNLLLSPVRFNIYAAEDIIVNEEMLYFKGEFVTSVTTLYGKATTDWLPLGEYYVQEDAAAAPYVLDKTQYPVSLTYDAQNESVQFSQTVSNVPQKATITVSKVDTESGIPVAGAVYIIKATEEVRVNGELKYRKGETVDTVTTNEKGIAVSKALYLGKYSVTEKSVPKPYTLDKTTHEVSLIYKNTTVSVFNETLQVSDMPQKAIIKLHKVDSETNSALANAVYEIYANEDISVNGDVKYLKDTLVDTVTTNENGEAYSSELYLGQYRLVEKTAPYGYVLDSDIHIADLEYQGQEVDVFTEGYTAKNAPQKAKIELLKVDKETNRPLANAVFEVYAASDVVLNGDLKYKANTLVDTLTTDNDGKAYSKLLYLGDYYIIEKTAPFGYVLNADRMDITLSYKGQTVSEYSVSVEASNIAQKGVITVSKSGEVFASVDKAKDVYTPVYAVQQLSGAVFNIIADEDIYTGDGTLRASKNEIVDTVTTGEDGLATSKELYLGRYRIEEATAPYGMVQNTTAQYATLFYAGQNTELVFESVSFQNERQKATIDLNKVLEQDELFGLGANDEILNVKFGLYAAEDLIAADGSSIPKDGLIEAAEADETGHIEFNADIPLGKYYVKEYSTDEHYILSDAKYPVEFAYAGQSVLAVCISANDGNVIDNELIRGTIIGKKVDDDGNAVAGAVMGLFTTETTEFTEETALMTATTDEDGKFMFENVPYGAYVVREIEAPEGFVLSTVSTPVKVSEQCEIVELEVLNSIITGSVKVIKVDAEDCENKLTGAVFEIFEDTNANGEYDEGVDLKCGELQDLANGEYISDSLRYNGYFLHEKVAPIGFLADVGYYYFEIRNNGEVVEVFNDAESQLFKNEPIKGFLEITKTDISDGSLIPNAGFRICDMNGNVVAEGYTDENGIATFELRYGKYTYEEFEAASGYVLDTTKHEFEIKENGEIVKAEMTNELIPVEIPKTGKETTFSIGGLAAAAATVLALTKKRKDEDEIA